MRATWRWVHSDLRTHRGEALFAVLASAGVIASLLLAAALLGYAASPWQRVFNQSQGSHVWLHGRDGRDGREGLGPAAFAPLASLDEVAAVSGPFRTAAATLESGGTRAGVALRATGTRPPDTARPLLTAGHWLTAPTGRQERTPHDQIVLERTLARTLWAEPGETVTVTLTGRHGPTTRTLYVVGVAETAEPRYRAGQDDGVGWILPATLDRLAPATTGQTVGLRLKDPGDTDYAVQRAVTLLGAERIAQVTKWQQAKADFGGDDRLLGRIFAAFGLAALLAAAVAVAGAVRARIRGQAGDIAVLKAVGFTPGQVIRGFLLQHLGFAVAGAALGTAATLALGHAIPGRVGEAVALWPRMPGHRAAVTGIPLAAVLLIAAATALAAWRAGRVPPVPAARRAHPAARPLSALGRRALGLRLSPVLVLGWRSAFTAPGRTRALGATARLALPIALMTVALVAWSTLGQFRTDPARVGRAAALTVRTQQPPPSASSEEALEAVPGVADAVPGAEFRALVPGQTGTITLRGLGTPDAPYPHTIAEGRAPAGPDEAVAGQGLLDLLGVRVGEWVRMTVGGRPQILHLVGRSIEPDHGGRVVSTTLDTLRDSTPGLRPAFHALVLRPGADPRRVASAVATAAEATGEGAEVRTTADPAGGEDAPRGVLAALAAVLALIALVELLTLIGTGVRDRVRDLLALRAIGLTPRQIGAVVVTSATLTALAAAVLGTAAGAVLGHYLVDAEAAATGLGAGVARLPAPALLAALVLATTTAGALAALAPGIRTARRRLVDSPGETL
ncbi:ABC transporter permease [Streptomyces sp. R302]|uniref:FtsX-like permease family protein n=1 Tax=unclassified Streptomyces TaxID=2593676 RepID=UPI00145F4842|nr:MULTISPECIES: FtsX-like permease family protein [unclassified Streptomyces]NML52667.1 ABC transporter permease [Streptomyces sp. R301]NML80404.1 ABC transporter permease [Streptomyces sp. R302]